MHSLLLKQLVLVDTVSTISVAIVASIKSFIVVSDVLVVKTVPSMSILEVVRNAISAFILVVSHMTPIVLTSALALS